MNTPDTRVDSPSAKMKAAHLKPDLWTEVEHPAALNPWFDPPEITDEIERLASYINGGGLELIEEIEG